MQEGPGEQAVTIRVTDDGEPALSTDVDLVLDVRVPEFIDSGGVVMEPVGRCDSGAVGAGWLMGFLAVARRRRS